LRTKNRSVTGLALLAVLALVLSVTAGSALSASTASGGGQAETAAKKKKKKKCKKGFKKVKKKNGKIKCVVKPVVRATLTWSNGDSDQSDHDLVVVDANGNFARAGSSAIPKSKISPDQSGTSGSETFTDLSPKPARALSFGVCYVTGGSSHGPFTITYVTADGQKLTDTQDPGESFFYEYEFGPDLGQFCAI
jgi:uncharacterized protein YfaP (DUF2135 family)